MNNNWQLVSRERKTFIELSHYSIQKNFTLIVGRANIRIDIQFFFFYIRVGIIRVARTYVEPGTEWNEIVLRASNYSSYFPFTIIERIRAFLFTRGEEQWETIVSRKHWCCIAPVSPPVVTNRLIIWSVTLTKCSIFFFLFDIYFQKEMAKINLTDYSFSIVPFEKNRVFQTFQIVEISNFSA